MDQRFEYLPLGLWEKTVLIMRRPHRWRSSLRPWIFDKKSGMRFQLAKDEETALGPLTSRMKNGSSSFTVAMAFDQASDALVLRRLGYGFVWTQLAQRTKSDWDYWLAGGLRRLRW